MEDMNYTAPQSSVVDPTQRIGDISSPLLRNYGAACGTEEDTHEVKPGLVLALESSPRKFLCSSPRLDSNSSTPRPHCRPWLTGTFHPSGRFRHSLSILFLNVGKWLQGPHLKAVTETVSGGRWLLQRGGQGYSLTRRTQDARR